MNFITITSLTSVMNKNKIDDFASNYPVFVFLWPKGASANSIQTEINSMYGDKCFTRKAIQCLVTFGLKSLFIVDC